MKRERAVREIIRWKERREVGVGVEKLKGIGLRHERRALDGVQEENVLTFVAFVAEEPVGSVDQTDRDMSRTLTARLLHAAVEPADQSAIIHITFAFRVLCPEASLIERIHSFPGSDKI
jgi:hypothetical protein